MLRLRQNLGEKIQYPTTSITSRTKLRSIELVGTDSPAPRLMFHLLSNLSHFVEISHFFIFCQICHISSKSDIFFQLPGTGRFEEKSGERWEYKIATKLVFIQIFVLLGTSVQSDIFCRKTVGKYCPNFFAGKNCPNFTRTHSTLLRNGSTVFEV